MYEFIVPFLFVHINLLAFRSRCWSIYVYSRIPSIRPLNVPNTIGIRDRDKHIRYLLDAQCLIMEVRRIPTVLDFRFYPDRSASGYTLRNDRIGLRSRSATPSYGSLPNYFLPRKHCYHLDGYVNLWFGFWRSYGRSKVTVDPARVLS